MPEVKIGQIWKDNDKRFSDRFLRVDIVEGDKAVCAVGHERQGRHFFSTAKTKISVRRFKPTSSGYTLVKDAQ